MLDAECFRSSYTTARGKNIAMHTIIELLKRNIERDSYTDNFRNEQRKIYAEKDLKDSYYVNVYLNE